jgi:hypothetical protein
LLLRVFVAARECPLAIAFTCACLSLTACTWSHGQWKQRAALHLVSSMAPLLSTAHQNQSHPRPQAPHIPLPLPGAEPESLPAALPHAPPRQAHIGRTRIAPPWTKRCNELVVVEQRR